MTFRKQVGNFIIPTDELIFFRGVGIPPTSNSLISTRVLVSKAGDFGSAVFGILRKIAGQYPQFSHL